MDRISFRDRLPEDDVRSIRNQKTSQEIKGDSLILPLPNTNPIVVWVKDNVSKDTHNMDDDEIKKCMEWPTSTKSLCHNCCHTFDTVPVPLPYRYDEKRKIYMCNGLFCSWQCSKAFNMTTGNIHRGAVNMNISILAYRMWVKYMGGIGKESLQRYCNYNIDPSPNKNVLIAFGGTTTIEEFRKDFCGIIPPDIAKGGKPFLNIKDKLYLPFAGSGDTYKNQVMDTTPMNPSMSNSNMSTMNKCAVNDNHKRANEFCEILNRAKDGRMVLKRERKEETKNTLMSAMGVTISKKKR